MRNVARLGPVLGLLVIAGCQTAPPTAAPIPTRVPTLASVPSLVPDLPSVVAPDPSAEPSPVADTALGELAPIAAQLPSSFRSVAGRQFALPEPAVVDVTPQVVAPAIAPDLGNVAMTTLLSPEQRARVAENGFVVSPGTTKEFYELYERARYDNVPVFVTSDSLLHVYHLLFDKVLRRAESTHFAPMLAGLDWAMLRTSIVQHEALAGTAWAEPARRNAAYFALAVKTLVPEWEVPAGLRDLVEPDLRQIEAHEGRGPSAIVPGQAEDWSQYTPRGHYTASEDLKRYLRAMMWHGRRTLRAESADETRQAALMTLAYETTLVNDTPAADVWSGIYEPTAFFVGRSDDHLPAQYGQALHTAYGPLADTKQLVDEDKFAAFQAEIARLPAPQINPHDGKGLRFMGQRFVLDAFVFEHLVAAEVPGRPLPKALDVLAALGSDRALAHLGASGDLALPNYQPNMDALRKTIAAFDEGVWSQNLYWSWLHGLQPLLEPVDAGYPEFMRSDAWLDKQLTTALASWTGLKRDTILYAKQVYAERGGSPPAPVPPQGYVEPVPLFYARIGALTKMTLRGLSDRGLIAESDTQLLEIMLTVCDKLRVIAEKELRGEGLTEDEYEYIRYYGAEIEALTFAASDDAEYGGRGGAAVEGSDPLQAAVVADVATDPGGGSVLEEGVGRVFDLYVVAPIEGQLVLTKGGVFSHYEFKQPVSDRLTDEAWRQRLASDEVPPLASWTGSFLVNATMTESLAQRIIRFNDMLAASLWNREMREVEPYLAEPELSETRAYVEALAAKRQAVGMQRMALRFLSFDLQDEQHATITTRERWSDELIERGSLDSKQVGVRGPYETVVTYTLQRPDDAWLVSKVVMRPEPPAWGKP
jgi:hypothetical protein